MFDGIAIMFKAVANAFGADIDVINDDLADNVNHFHLWADTLIALFRTSCSVISKSQNVSDRRCRAGFDQQAGKYCNKRDFKQFRI